MTTKTSAAARTFYRTLVQVEVLSEDPIPDDCTLKDLLEEIDIGDCSGRTEWLKSNEAVTGKRMAKLLQAQGSDPGFFRLTDKGADMDDVEDWN